ncbi:hypothetical protein [Frankia sp. Cppng1_Ct_nod]|uniref:hypothetical protein n=1 Tax=Frankia sp. Cppng1_Ct_nod TaxID=2897162 RepID=UPI0013EFB28C|nr:hypothetical protein [Frankia sp. Cppng1_Ct_nod]
MIAALAEPEALLVFGAITTATIGPRRATRWFSVWAGQALTYPRDSPRPQPQPPAGYV